MIIQNSNKNFIFHRLNQKKFPNNRCLKKSNHLFIIFGLKLIVPLKSRLIPPRLLNPNNGPLISNLNHLKCSLNETILIDAKLFDTIDPKESSYVITKDKNNQLTITLSKSNIGLFWNELFREGQSISGDIKMIHLSETNNNNNAEEDDEVKQPYNNQQLEECDQYSNETDTYLVRFDGDTHRLTHQALINNQILFTTLNPPSLCIRHDVNNLP